MGQVSPVCHRGVFFRETDQRAKFKKNIPRGGEKSTKEDIHSLLIGNKCKARPHKPFLSGTDAPEGL